MLKYLFCLLIVFFHTNLALYSANDSVTQLNDVNFDEFISRDGVTVVKFYASWCKHCEDFAPKIKKAASILKGVVRFGVVDNQVHSSLGNRFNVNSYPTTLMFRSDKDPSSFVRYTGPRTVEELVAFLTKQVHEYIVARGKNEGVHLAFLTKESSTGSSENKHQAPEAVINLTDQNFDSLVLQSGDEWLVSFISPHCGHCKMLAPQWKEAAVKLQGKVKVGTVDATTNNNLAARFHIQGFPTIKFFKSNIMEDYEGDRSVDSLVQFALTKKSANRPPPDVNEITSAEVLQKACDNRQLCIIGFLPQLFDCQSDCRKNYLSVMKEAANKHKDKDWGWLWSAARTHMELEKVLQVGGFGYPAMVAINMKKEKTALMRGPFSSDGIRDFLYSLMQGKSGMPLSSFSALPEIEPSTAWDGKDAPVVDEEEEEEESDLSQSALKQEL